MPFIISCGRPWYQRHSEEEGIKADREQWEKSEVKDGRMEGGIRGCFNNLDRFLPTNQMNKWRGIWRHRKDLTVHGRLNSAQLNSAMREHPQRGRRERGKWKWVQKFEAYLNLPFALISGLTSSLSLRGRRSQQPWPWVSLWEIVMNLHTIAPGAHGKCRPGSMSWWNDTGGLQKLKMTN